VIRSIADIFVQGRCVCLVSGIENQTGGTSKKSFFLVVPIVINRAYGDKRPGWRTNKSAGVDKC
jgi:hypothetical protein